MGSNLRIVFMGSPEFAVPSLQKLANSGHKIVTVVSGTDKKRGRGNELSPTPVKSAALALGLPVLGFASMKDPGLESSLKDLLPDLIVIVAFKILPDRILSIPKFGSINLHASLLPAYRGAAPIHHAVMNGETKTGCTVFKLDSGIDTGGILLQKATPIGPDETTGSVYDKLMRMGGDLIVEAVALIASGKAEFRPQDDGKASPAPKLFDEDCKVDFNRPAIEVHNKIRGLSPFPCAYAMLDGKRLKLLASHYREGIGKKGAPGNVSMDGDEIYVACLDESIRLDEVRYEGKRQMKAVDFFRGFRGGKWVLKGG